MIIPTLGKTTLGKNEVSRGRVICFRSHWWREGFLPHLWDSRAQAESPLFTILLVYEYTMSELEASFESKCAKCRSESCWRRFLVLRMEVNPSRARSTHRPSVGALFWIQNPPQNRVLCHEVAIKDEALFPFLASRMRFKHPHAAKSCWSALPTFNFSHSSPTLFQGAVLQAPHTQFSRMPSPSS